jgi:hypothetical protein
MPDDLKISAMTPITGANIADDDVIPVVDVSTSTNRNITRDEYLSEVKRVIFSRTNYDAAPEEGVLTWDADEKTLSLGLNGGDTVLQIGQENHIRVRNNSGALIANGSVVMQVGTVGNSGRLTIAKAVADGSVDGHRILGIATEDIANGADGLITNFGKVRQINTTAFADGAVLYANPAVPGGMTATRPAHPNAVVVVAFVVHSHASGTLFVHPSYESQPEMVTLTGTQTLTNKTLASPALTGTPTAPTAAQGTNTTQVATTEFANAIAAAYAQTPEDTTVPGGAGYSALHYAAKAGADAAAADAARELAEAAVANAQAAALTVATWTALAALTAAVAGTGAEVLDSDTGTHTDPVAGGTVNNAGRYSWSASPAGWKRIGATGLSAKVSNQDLLTVVSSKNLYLAANKRSGYRINSGDPAYIEAVVGWSCTEFIPVTAGLSYTISANANKRAGAAFYSSASGAGYVSGSYNATTVTAVSPLTLTAPTGALYLAINLQSDTIPEPSQVQIEVGSSKTSYIAGFAPYYSTILPAKLPAASILSPTQADTLIVAAMRSTIPARVLKYMDDALVARLIAPKVAIPASGTIYVAASNATVLPVGNDTTGTGSAAAPYLTLTKALTMVPGGGDYIVAADGTFAENTAGRLILAGDFTLPVVIKPHTGASVIITNASSTNGVIQVRNAKATNIQFSGVTIQPSTDGCPVISTIPLDANSVASGLGFFDCLIKQRSWTAAVAVVDIQTNYPVTGLSFVRCQFERVAGASTATNPTIIKTSSTTKVHSNIGFWDCWTSGASWSSFSSEFCGVSGVTIARNALRTSVNHALLIGTDTSGTGVAAVTDLLVYGNDITAIGTNPHGLEVGESVSGLVAMNAVRSGLQGIVVKGTSGVTVVQNAVTMTPSVANGSAIYPKASSGTIFDGNSVIVHDTGLVATGFREAADGATVAGNTTLIGNKIEVRGASAVALSWGATGQSSGGATSDDNIITLVSGAALGSVRGTTVTTTAGMRSAWTSSGLSGDVATNDATTIVASI